MTLEARIVAQFRRPSGPLGRLAGLIMARRPSNRRRNQWTIETLGIGAGARGLELGCGPGLAVEAALEAGAAFVLGLDHSAEMARQAGRRNETAVRAGRAEIRIGDLEALRDEDGPFDAVWMINVAQFLADRRAVFRRLAAVLRADGRLAMTYQPRHRGARAEDAAAFAETVGDEMRAAGFDRIDQYTLPLAPVPAVCVIGHAPGP